MTQKKYYDIKRDSKFYPVSMVCEIHDISKATVSKIKNSHNHKDYLSKCNHKQKTNKKERALISINKTIVRLQAQITKLFVHND